MSAFKEMAKNSGWLASGTPFLKERGLLMRSEVDESRPEIATARAHLAPLMRKRSSGAVIVLSEGERPLSKSAVYPWLEKLMMGSCRDIYKLHQQLGPYPAELEFVYPFTQTVTDGVAGSMQVREAVERLKRMGYSSILLCGKDRTRTVKGRA